MKRILVFLMLAIPYMAMAQQANPSEKVIIIYENDPHSTLSGYPKLAGLKEKTLSETPNILVVSGGDFSADFMPGTKLGNRSQGAGIIKIMNKIGYDYLVPGNHDFDFSVENMMKNFSNLDATALCCNLKEIAGETFLLPGYAVRSIGGIKVGFVGVANPKTISRQLMKYFADEEGNMLYSFCEESLCEVVQQNVDKARSEGADYVIVLSHLGDRANGSVTSLDLIAATQGIDVVLDAHAHSLIPEQRLANKEGKEVILSSTGLKFANIGLLTINTDGHLSAEMVSVESLEPLTAIQEFIDEVEKEY
ncbi:MAG: metallophosphoesterase [Bacteroidaceae bacterium]|nr:metallophosphoesterase [Bacteroidaceae bacterium]